jgi:cell division protein ZapA (FtsZ GTPase activity inhibitor)
LEHLVTIELFGQPYTFKADTNAAEAKEVADLLRREVQKVQDQHAGQSTYIPKLTVLIIAALNIANHTLQLKKDYGEFVDKTADRCGVLNRMLDEGLHEIRSLRHYHG